MLPNIMNKAAQSKKSNGFGLEAYLYYQEHPADFVRDMILQTQKTGIDVTEEQEKFLNMVFRVKLGLEKNEDGVNKFGVTMPAGHGVGKTAGLAMLILTWLYLWPTCKIPVTATKKEQIRDNMWAEASKFLEKSLLKDEIEWQKTKIFMKDSEETRFAVARTGTTQEALQGFHDPHLLFIVEEASGVGNEIFEPAMGALTNEGAVMVLAGNPTKRSGYFFDSFTKNKRFVKIHIPCLFPDGRIHRLVGPDYPSMMAEEFGKDSSAYRIRVLGLPPKLDDDSLIPWEWVEEASEFNQAANEDYKLFWGVDPAVTGDRCCTVHRRGSVVYPDIWEWRGLDTMQIAGRITHNYKELHDSQKPHRIYVDIIGVGRGVYDRLRENGLPTIGIAVSRVSSSKERFVRLRDELWWKGREWFETRAVSIPKDKAFIRELTIPKYTTTGDGRVLAESKDTFKKRMGGDSPDKADAFLLTLAGGVELIPKEERHERYRGYQHYGDGTTWQSG